MNKIVTVIAMLLSAASIELLCPVHLDSETLIDAFVALENSDLTLIQQGKLVVGPKVEAVFLAYAHAYPQRLFESGDDDECCGLLNDFLDDGDLQLHEGLVDKVKEIKRLLGTQHSKGKLQPGNASDAIKQANLGEFWRSLPFRWQARLLDRITQEIENTNEKVIATKYRILENESIRNSVEFDGFWLGFSHLAKSYTEETSSRKNKR